MTSTRYAGLAGRTVIITGGASGIGEGLVRAFAAQDSKVAFLDILHDEGMALANDIATSGDDKPLFVPCDLQDIPALRMALTKIQDRLGHAGVLINNAACDQRQDFARVTPDEFDWMMRVNLRHVFFACQAIIPQMRTLGGGSIINFSSGAWVRGLPDMQAYSAGKAAIVGLTNSLAREVGRHRIRVNALAPGMVVTERQRRLWFPDPAKIEEGLARQCIPEPCLPEHAAKAALFLASDDADMITKQFIMVNGGTL